MMSQEDLPSVAAFEEEEGTVSQDFHPVRTISGFLPAEL